MRLHLTVKRHKLEDTPVVWAIDTSSNPIIFHLLQQVNDIIPIESDGKWGLEDYAVEVKGTTGVNYECLHFQHVKEVLKDEDEVVIRPLLSQDIHVRNVSGRVQISTAGRRLVDGVPLGKPLLRKARDRPAINIPPRKRARIDYDGDDDENDEDDYEETAVFPPLEDGESEASEDEEGNRQLVLHADFDDEDSEDDEDFVPGEDGAPKVDSDIEEDIEEDDEMDGSESEKEAPAEPRQDEDNNSEADEAALADVNDEATRAQIRKLKSAFPIAPMAVCKYVLEGSEGKDVGEAYEAMLRGFRPVFSKNAVTEVLQGVTERKIATPKSRSKAKTPPVQEDNLDSKLVEPDENESALINHFDQNGLPGGSIKSGKALKFMAEAVQGSPSRPRSEARRSASVAISKSVRLADDRRIPLELTSTPFIEKESQEEEESEEDSNEESEESSEEETSGSEDSSDSSSDNEEGANNEGNNTSSSDSESDSSSDSSSEDESPEEASSKHKAATPPALSVPPSVTKTQSTSKPMPPSRPPGQGLKATKTRNARRRQNNALERFKKNGILPAGTTISELNQMDVDDETSSEAALSALEKVRATREESQSQSSLESQQMEAARQRLLADLASGGVDVDAGYENHVQSSPAVDSPPEVEMAGMDVSSAAPAVSQEIIESHQVTESQKNFEMPQSVEPSQSAAAHEVVESPAAEPQEDAKPLSPALDHIEPTSNLTNCGNQEIEMARPSSAPAPAPAADNASASPKPPPASAESSQSSSSRRPKFSFGGAAKRTLFGALGMRTPKTKDDEEKIRKDLMKGVRPLLPPKSTEEVEPAVVDDVDTEDPDSWREKINYRAVECVQEGVELSEPPFPFVQRWDPQQQNSWSQKGDRGGKRKQDQRNQSQFYQDDTRASKKQKRRKGEHTYAEEQEYLEGSYEPSFQDETMTSQFNDSIKGERPQSEDVEDIDQHLMNDLQKSATGISQGPEDLAPLPDDPSTLPDLQDGMAKVGMTIAFKQLEMSEATNWQPQISAYRTAIVIDIAENSELQLTLAMRDRAPSNKRYDEETGQRVYAKFEMDDGDEPDEDSDDGTLNLSFGELREAKIVRQPPSNVDSDVTMEEASQTKPLTSFDLVTLSNEEGSPAVQAENPTDELLEEPAEAQFSHVTETPLNSDAPDSQQQEDAMMDAPADHQDPVVDNSVPAHNSPAVEEEDVATVAPHDSAESISEESLDEHDDPIKEGGVQIGRASSVARDAGPDDLASPGDAAVFDKLQPDFLKTPSSRPYSPKFNGLGSSPAREPRDASKSPEVAAREESPQVPFQSSWETYEEPGSSPPNMPEKSPEPSESALADASGWETVNEADSSMVAEKSPERPALGSAPVPTLAAPEPAQPKSLKKLLSRQVPISRAQQMWQAMQPRKRSPTPDSGAESSKTSPAPTFGLDGADERDPVEYPKLSVGSSFTSDVGRQPDFNFNETIDLSTSTPKGSTSKEDLDLQSARSAAREAATSSMLVENPLSDSEPDLPSRKPVNKSVAVERHDVIEDDDSSDELPTLEELTSNSQRNSTIKHEKSPTRSTGRKEIGNGKTMHSIEEDGSERDILGEDQTTPKASQKQRSLSTRPAQKRNSEKSASQSRASVSRSSQPRQSQPKATQESVMIDLTGLSSSVEPESPVRQKESPPPRKFKRYDVDDDDDTYEEPGWRPKKANNIRGVEVRRQTGVGLKPSSQTSLKQNRRKTTSR